MTKPRGWGRYLLGAVIAAGAILVWADLIHAQSIEAILEAKAQRTPAQRKLSSQFLSVTERVQPPDSGRRPATQAAPVTGVGVTVGVLADVAPPVLAHPRSVPVTDEQTPTTAVENAVVTVDIRTDVTDAVLARIRALGGTVLSSVPKYRAIRARLPLSALETLATLDAVQSIRPADQAITHRTPARSAVTQAVVTAKRNTTAGDVAHQANVARTTHSVDGTGISIGVLSDGVAGLAAQQATGDVPARVTVLPGQEGSPSWSSCGYSRSANEGVAMLEIVHDLAPGAELFFATGFAGAAQMAQNIEDLCAAGADIIVDDIGYLLAPAFQDGVIAQAVSTVVANGCYYFSSAGNGGNKNDGTSGVWEGDFVEGPEVLVDGVSVGKAHEFDTDKIENRVVTARPRALTATLQWADPVEGSANDYDLFLIDADNTVLASSTNTQDGTQAPIEYLIDSSPGCSADYTDARLVIVKNAGAADRYLRLTMMGGTLAIATAGQTFGHSAAQDAIGVAAVDVADAGGTGGVFNGTESVETFSSDGPRRIFFEANGTPITPGNFSSTGGRVLQKPDLTAADGVATSTPGFSDFHGTSAAAPHAAAIAALVLEAAGGPAQDTVDTQDELRTAMTGAALDIEATGVDRDSGAGIVMAPGAVDAVDVAVADRNGAPTVTSTLTDRTFAPGADAVPIDLAAVFNDPDDDALTYTMQVSPESTVVTLSGSQLTLTPGARTTVVVTVRATDPGGLAAMQTFSVTVGAAGDRDYDIDNNNLIDVATLAQLDAVRYDLNGDGLVDGAIWRPYYAAFVEARLGMGCPDGCVGYELAANLDFFDTNGDGQVDTNDDTNGDGQVDAEDNATYWNSGDGWAPIGSDGEPFAVIFEGNRYTVSHLFIDRDDNDYTGLFGATGASSVIRRLGVVDANVTGDDYVGGLVGGGAGEIRTSYVTGQVEGTNYVGGLVGANSGTVTASYATARVTADAQGGGLVGVNDSDGRIRASYATGRVSGEDVGGLVGANAGTVDASYATGRVLGTTGVGGLAGSGDGVFRSSYWDLETSGVRVGVGADDSDNSGWLEAGESRTLGVAGRPTAALQTPTRYDGIYRTWNLDLDDDAVPDKPWFLHSAGHYPILASLDYRAGGYQLSQGPTLTATTSDGQAQVVLDWTALDASRFWSQGPVITYTLIRDDGATFEVLLEESSDLQHTDTSVTVDTTYTYQVAAVVQGGEATRSATLTVVAGTDNQPPVAVGGLMDQTLRVGGSAVTMDGAGAFVDPEDDTLAYTVSSSDTTVVTVAVSGTQVTLTPVAAGTATITVTATDTDGSNTSAEQRFVATVWSATAVDYDTDDDGLIEIRALSQLDAVRHDLDGDGEPAADGAASYRTAFPDAVERLGCGGIDGCTGYELAANLDFDTNGSGGADAGDAYWNGGVGWTPIGLSHNDAFAATFDGNGRTIANLFINADTTGGVDYTGLFGVAGTSSVIRGVGLTDITVRAEGTDVGGLVGWNRGVVTGSYAAGRVVGDDFVGGLVGWNVGVIAASYATGRVTGDLTVGGLVGANFGGAVIASYATGRVAGRSGVGGLVGLLFGGTVDASYATGRATGPGNVGGLVGSTGSAGGDVLNSYWDIHTSGLSLSSEGQGQETRELQTPEGYTGLYQAWEVDLDGDLRRESPWDFGTTAQYPVLSLDVDGNGTATWQEMGYQLRQGPTLRASGQPTLVSLTWIAVDASHWTPMPAARYTVFRDPPLSAGGTTTETLVEELDGLRYTDTSVTAGNTYRYQVVAVVSGGEAAWSAPMTVIARTPSRDGGVGGGGAGGGGGVGGGGGGEDSQDWHGNTAARATLVRLGSTAPWMSSIAGQINEVDDIDYFELSVPQAGVLVVETTGSTDTVGTVWQGDEELASADHGGVRRNFRLSTRVRAGRVVVAVEGNGIRTGDYTLEMRLLVGYLENPGPNSFQSGVGVLSGWVCEADRVEFEIIRADGTVLTQDAAYGTERSDTAYTLDGTAICGDTDNGFGLLYNWNRLGNGEHEVVTYVDGAEFGRATVTVTTVGEGEEEEFLPGVAGGCTVEDFPMAGESVTVVWQQTNQNFMIAGGAAPTGENRAGTPGVGYLENPGPHSFQSGVGVISGWVCEAQQVTIELIRADGSVLIQDAAYGTERPDTAYTSEGAEICGDTDNGFGALFNWNRLGDGVHTVVAYVDAEELGRATVRVTTVGEGDEEEFLPGAAGGCTVADFPTPGQTVTLEWQQNSQNFVITNVE